MKQNAKSHAFLKDMMQGLKSHLLHPLFFFCY